MEGIGKVSQAILADTVYHHHGAARDDVQLGPTHGADFGVIETTEDVVALASDPLFVPVELGAEPAAWYGIHILLSDVALSGLTPSHLALTVTLPAHADLDQFADIWEVFDAETTAHDIGIVTGHTGRYEECAYPYIGGGTALAVGDRQNLVVPTDAAPGEVVIATKGPAVETVGVLGMRFGDALPVESHIVEQAKDRFWEISVVPDARVAAGIEEVSAMHDATERGVINAAHELATVADVELHLDRSAFPIGEGVEAVCAALDIDPWTASSEGTVLLTVDPDSASRVLAAFEQADIRAAEVGSVEAGTGVTIDGESVSEPESDPFWGAYTALAEAGGNRRD